jgi:hypothetical protein
MTDEAYTRKSRRTLADADIEQLAGEAATTTDYDVEALKRRCSGTSPDRLGACRGGPGTAGPRAARCGRSTRDRRSDDDQ